MNGTVKTYRQQIGRRQEAFAAGFLDGFGSLARFAPAGRFRATLRQPASPSQDRALMQGDFANVFRSLRERTKQG